MAEAVVTFALEKIHDLLLEKGGLSSRVGDDVKALERQLEEIKGLIEDADRRRHESETVKSWIAEIRDLAYRAEAAIEIYAARVSSKRRRGAKKLLRRYACILKECRSLHQLDSEIKHIKSGLEVVTKKLLKHGIVKKVINEGESSAASDNQNLARKTDPYFKIEDCFVGMEDKLKLLESLMEDKQQPRVISVWGMGGIGKTAIAREVYNKMINQSKPSCFDRFAWVCITQQCQVRSILEDVLRQLDPQKTKNVSSLSSLQHIPQIGEDFSKLSDMELMERLCEVQRANRCLIVLDDLWRTSDQWDYLNPPFLVKDLRSKILVTTRHQDVAAKIGFPVELELLDVDHAWELLQKKAFPYDNIPDFAFQEGGEKLHHIGNEMVQKCGRLPLAISLLGGVLRKKNSMDDWETVNKNFPEYIHPIEGVLNLSYEELPYYLKPCFLYLGILQEDEKMPVALLYRMWIAQGMISPGKTGGNEETLIEIAENYLSDLVSRCIVQVEVNDVTPMEKKFRTCQLHDVVRVLCLLKGEKENFGVQILKYPCGDNRTLLKNKTRYLVVNMEEEVEQGRDHEFTISGEEDTRKHVRSFHILSAKAIEFPTQGIVDFQRFKMLRDLVIIGFKFAGRKLPRGITNLVHLRSLLLRECELDELPSSIRHLVYLETLDLFHSSNVRVPNALKKMFRLKYLVLPSYFGVTNDNYRLRLDEGLGELESLMGFDSRVHEFKSAPKMKNLRRFSAFVHDNESLLVITKAIATTWNKLQLCAISIEKGCELREEGWMMLKQEFTCPNLHFLRIHVPLGKLLVECMNNIICSKLVELILEDCEIEDDPMGILGNLPSLRQLCLALGSFVGEEMTCPASSFPHLKTLELAGLPKLREWRVEAGAMRLLSLLYIFDCPRLEMVPDGLSRISTLKKLTISGMPELGKRVTPSGDDFHKVCHVPSIHIHDRSPFTQDEV